MRFKVALLVVMSALCVVGFALLIILKRHRVSSVETQSSLADATQGKSASNLDWPAPSKNQIVPPAAGLSPQAAADRLKYVENRLEELRALSSNDDAAALNTILSELNNPDRQIRKGALEAAIQFGDRSNTLPRLQELSLQTGDAAEVAEILAAIDYINLPSLSEYLEEQRSRLAAQGLTNRPPKATFRGGSRITRMRPRSVPASQRPTNP